MEDIVLVPNAEISPICLNTKSIQLLTFILSLSGNVPCCIPVIRIRLCIVFTINFCTNFPLNHR